MTGETSTCRFCGYPIIRPDDPGIRSWWHQLKVPGASPIERGCRAASYTRDGTWDERLRRDWRATPARQDGAPPHVAPRVAEQRACLRCGTDLTGTMGCYIFVAGRNVPGLLCPEHGSNGANGMSQAEYDRLMLRQLPMADDDPRLRAAIRATRAGEAGMMWQIAGTSAPGSGAARRELLAQAIQAAERVDPDRLPQGARLTRTDGGFDITVPCPVCGWPITRHLDDRGHLLAKQPTGAHDGAKHGVYPRPGEPQ